jgi:hypothetical protein
MKEWGAEETNPIQVKIVSGLWVKIELLSPCGTELFNSMASSND